MKTTFEYHGYYGSAEPSIEDNCLYGKILRINDLVLYEADTMTELHKAFTAAVDDYIETCRTIGKEPQKSTPIPARQSRSRSLSNHASPE